MYLIRSIVRPEKAQEVMDALADAGFPGITKVSVAGRGQQMGLKVGETTYDELPKELLMSVVKEKEKDLAVSTVLKYAKSGESGSYGDGKIFISPVLETYTISSGFKEE